MVKALTPKERILKERGLLQHRPAPRKHRVLVPVTRQIIPDKLKTPLMRYLEEKYKVQIGDVLMSGSLTVVSKRLGEEVDRTTLCKWIRKLRLRYTEDNLPICDGCKRGGPACTVGICYILAELELYDLIDLKKEELMNEA